MRNINKGDYLTVILIVVHFLVMLKFGLPFPKRELTRGTTYKGAARESQFLSKLYVIRKPFVFTVEIGIPFLFGLMAFQKQLVNLATGFGMIKLAKKAIGSSLITCSITAVAALGGVVLSLMTYSISQNETLKEHSRIEFLWLLALTFALFVGIEGFLKQFLYLQNIREGS